MPSAGLVFAAFLSAAPGGGGTGSYRSRPAQYTLVPFSIQSLLTMPWASAHAPVSMDAWPGPVVVVP